MSQINVSQLTFSYATHHQNIFENTSFVLDTDWKLGFISRNGRGKTTLLQLLIKNYEYQGNIRASVSFDYFPFQIPDSSLPTKVVLKNIIGPYLTLEAEMDASLIKNDEASLQNYSQLLDQYMSLDGFIIEELIERELNKLAVSIDVLQRAYMTLSNGEQTKVLLAALFLKKNNFLLIDEPTNHLDLDARQVVSRYLNSKKGFILVSHDRHFLDHCIDHVLSINKSNIEVQKGNFSSWQANKTLQDQYELAENEKLKKNVHKLALAVDRTACWSNDLEATKFGGGPVDRGTIGHKSAKMMKRSKAIEHRRENILEDKKNLLKNLEESAPLSLRNLESPKKVMLEVVDLSTSYQGKIINEPVTFTVHPGDRIALAGKNGSGKSSIIKLLLSQKIDYLGYWKLASGLQISYISQDTTYLCGNLKTFVQQESLDESLFKSILHKLDFSREQFEKDICSFSAGQKKKVLLAASLCKPSHLFIWDEPLNYIDVLSRIQIEELILDCQPTLIFVEHDQFFSEKIGTKRVQLTRCPTTLE